jgi:hypothetical protein
MRVAVIVVIVAVVVVVTMVVAVVVAVVMVMVISVGAVIMLLGGRWSAKIEIDGDGTDAVVARSLVGRYSLPDCALWSAGVMLLMSRRRGWRRRRRRHSSDIAGVQLRSSKRGERLPAPATGGLGVEHVAILIDVPFLVKARGKRTIDAASSIAFLLAVDVAARPPLAESVAIGLLEVVRSLVALLPAFFVAIHEALPVAFLRVLHGHGCCRSRSSETAAGGRDDGRRPGLGRWSGCTNAVVADYNSLPGGGGGSSGGGCIHDSAEEPLTLGNHFAG